MNEYEKTRLENIRKNEEMLKQLGLDLGKSKVKKVPPKKDPSTTKKRNYTASIKASSNVEPTRKSSRIRGIQAIDQKLDLDQVEKMITRKQDGNKHEVYQMKKSNIDYGKEVKLEDSNVDESDITYFKLVAEKLTNNSIDSSKNSNPTDNYVKEEGGLPINDETYIKSKIIEKSGRVSNVLEQAEKVALENIFADMNIRHEENCVGVVSSRIYSLAVHPSKDSSILVCAGSKTGSLGFLSMQKSGYRTQDWENVLSEAIKNIKRDADNGERSKNDNAFKIKKEDILDIKSENEESHGMNSNSNDDEEYSRFSFEPHSDVISTVVIPRQQSNFVYTSSYDGKVRYLDLNHPTSFNQVMNLNDDPKIISIDLQYQTNSDSGASPIVWFSTFSGYTGFCDSRVSGGIVHEFQSHDSRVGCVSTNPVYKNIIATSSLDRTVKVWDIRSMNHFIDETLQEPDFEKNNNSKKPKNETNSNGLDVKQNLEFEPDLADSITDKQFARHNNKTGRWISMFRTQWHPNVNFPSCFAIGNMDRSLDIFSGRSLSLTSSLYDKDLVTTIPAVNAFHPSLAVLATGNASGKVAIWS
ncbi:DNA damage-binding protein CMR1 [Smittium culicis]|uniref:DNA damage-binding protein CMR1 n=1 Tax=Smittium culicis TaxID=133412 RepID=A0A1R1YMY8_9FUNG|nr:DNA damage-binding protein CMR1 [Smittium culicis]